MNIDSNDINGRQNQPNTKRVVDVSSYINEPILLPELGQTWGRWKFTGYYLEYYIRPGKLVWNVDLKRCNNSTEILDWICQARSKSWMNAEQLGNLVIALDEIFGYIQNTLLQLEGVFDAKVYLEESYLRREK
jgi:hypothetical protein